MSATRYAISWIYDEFQIVRMKQGQLIDSWTAPFPVRDLASLAEAMSEASQHIDLIHGGDVAIAYEDDLHTHEFFDLPNMVKKDLEKILVRKVEKNKPFEGDASWCYHEANHGEDEEGILLHLMPKDIVDATIRICQDFYLTPRRLVPLTEVVAELIPTYEANKNEIIVVVALFSERTEIITSLSDGEVLGVRELPYSAYADTRQRLITDINRTLSYAKNQFKQEVNTVWLVGKDADQIQTEIESEVEAILSHDPNGLDPFFWSVNVANLSGQQSANFIPLFARKKINSTLFYRVALWLTIISAIAAGGIHSAVDSVIASHHINAQEIESEIIVASRAITKFENLQLRRDKVKHKLQLLQANAHNLPALFINHLGHIVPDGLTILRSEVLLLEDEWKVTLQGESQQSLSEVVTILQQLESELEAAPWNITVTKSWKTSWYEQLQSGSASTSDKTVFEIVGLMQ
ncbi:MAG: hypothetical protein JKX75_08150 [Gammaproteobacteria bacterium]|nr:hypothetical protein [Gammaproteobacteria bacterium]